jgi:hypothetical protein
MKGLKFMKKIALFSMLFLCNDALSVLEDPTNAPRTRRLRRPERLEIIDAQQQNLRRRSPSNSPNPRRRRQINRNDNSPRPVRLARR